jgi:hypothetical protein
MRPWSMARPAVAMHALIGLSRRIYRTGTALVLFARSDDSPDADPAVAGRLMHRRDPGLLAWILLSDYRYVISATRSRLHGNGHN